MNQTLLMPGLALASSLLPRARGNLELPDDHRPVWSELFDQSGGPDPRRWVCDSGAGLAQVQSGRLVMRGRADQGVTLSTRWLGQWTYGFFEIRARLPHGVGQRVRMSLVDPAGEAARHGALDLLLQDGDDPGCIAARVETAASSGPRALRASTRVPSSCSRFHRYQLLWTPDAVVFGVDGFAYLRVARPDGDARHWPFDRPLCLQLALGAPGHHVERAPALELAHVLIHQAQEDQEETPAP